jgi:hypothetical protein
MNWELAIERNREALERIVMALFALVGLGEGETVATLPRHLHSLVLRILRPAESAVRRLIVSAARGIVVGPRKMSRVSPGRDPKTCSARPDTAGTPPILPLLDPLKKFSFDKPRRRARGFPRICIIGLTDPAPVPPLPSPDDPVGAERIFRRLRALRCALDDLPGQACRLARWRARSLAVTDDRPRRMSVLRPGYPPGRRKRSRYEVDDVLRECHSLARYALSLPDT